MTLKPDFKNELLEILKKSSLLIDKSRKYQKVNNEYKTLRQSITKKLLDDNNIVCKDLENYIDKKTGDFSPFDNLDTSCDLELKTMFKNLKHLYLQKQEFGWKDDTDWSVNVILGLAPLKNLEKEIFSTFGNKEGRKIMNDAKIEVSKFEKENNINVFGDDIEKLNALDNILVLFSKTNDIKITKDNNLTEEIITLNTIDNESVLFKKLGQITFNNKIYLDLKIIESLNDQEYFFYIVEQTTNGQKFVMEQDDDIYDKLLLKFEKFTTQTLINNKKKNKC